MYCPINICTGKHTSMNIHMSILRLCHYLLDIAAHRLEFAKKMGADHTILVEKMSPEELAKKIREILGAPPDITLECSGAGPSITTGILVHFSVCVCVCVC